MLDQFYTNDDIAFKCYNIVKSYTNLNDYDIILEPSAGQGAFFKLFPIEKRLGLDIDPKYKDIIKQDFLTYKFDINKKYIVIGNPPFGKISSLAIKFFNYSALFADIIAFIVPRTFKRVSVQNSLNLSFKLIYDEDLPLQPCCFTPPMNAKCCFQIWKKETIKRNKIIYELSHPDFDFLKYGPLDSNNQPTPPKNADFVIKAYGSNCGEIVSCNLDKLRPKSWHWIKSNIDIEILKQRFSSLDYSISKDSVRQDSLGKGDLIFLYKQKYAL
jgi:hypothetical protein